MRKSNTGHLWIAIQALAFLLPLLTMSTISAYADPTPTDCIGQVKCSADGAGVDITNAVVTATLSDAFYIESSDRASGIRVQTTNYTVSVGHHAEVVGQIQTNLDGERYVNPASIADSGTGNNLTPIGMNNKCLGGGNLKYGASTAQAGIYGACGWNNIGILIRTNGKIIQTGAGWLTIDDGSGVYPKVTFPSGVSLPAAGDNVIVTGISSCEEVNGHLQRVVRARGANDITDSNQLPPTTASATLYCNGYFGNNQFALPNAPMEIGHTDLTEDPTGQTFHYNPWYLTGWQLDSNGDQTSNNYLWLYDICRWDVATNGYDDEWYDQWNMVLGESYDLMTVQQYTMTYSCYPDGLNTNASSAAGMVDMAVSLPGDQSGQQSSVLQMIGHPFAHTTLVKISQSGDNVFFTDGIQMLSWHDAALAGWVYNVMNGYDATINDSFPVYMDGSGANLEPGRAYWTYTYKNNIAAIIPSAADPSITTQPVAQTICSGGTTTFSVVVMGAPLLNYQWRRNGSNIPNAITASYATGTAGAYDCVITNAYGSATSNAVTLTVNAAPAITTQPASQTVPIGTYVTFTVYASGPDLAYQWRKDGTNISGATTYSYYTNVAGSYDCVVSNSCGTITSNSATLALRNVVFVSKSGNSTQDGLSWATAFNSLQQGIDSVANNGGGEVWVATGTYVPGPVDPVPPTNVADLPSGCTLPSGYAYCPSIYSPYTYAFFVQEGVSLYGGFAGSETAREQRSWTNNVTTLSGMVSDPNAWMSGLPIGPIVDMVVSLDQNHSVQPSTVDGFTICYRLEEGTEIGSGIACERRSCPVIRNNTISNNGWAWTPSEGGDPPQVPELPCGGGIWAYGCQSITIDHNTIEYNRARFGAGIYLTECTATTISDNNISWNTCQAEFSTDTGRGAGICYDWNTYDVSNASLIISGNQIAQNTATGQGGGIFVGANRGGLTLVIDRNSIWENSGGAGVEVAENAVPGDSSPSVSITHNNIASNYNSVSGGGGLRIWQCTAPLIAQNYIHGNWGIAGGGGLYLQDNPPTRDTDETCTYVVNNVFEDNETFAPTLGDQTGCRSDSVGGAIYSEWTSVQIVNNTFVDHYDWGIIDPGTIWGAWGHTIVLMHNSTVPITVDGVVCYYGGATCSKIVNNLFYDSGGYLLHHLLETNMDTPLGEGPNDVPHSTVWAADENAVLWHNGFCPLSQSWTPPVCYPDPPPAPQPNPLYYDEDLYVDLGNWFSRSVWVDGICHNGEPLFCTNSPGIEAYRLQAGSFAHQGGAGMAPPLPLYPSLNGLYVPPDDFDGTPRSNWYGPVDIGAFEGPTPVVPSPCP